MAAEASGLGERKDVSSGHLLENVHNVTFY